MAASGRASSLCRKTHPVLGNAGISPASACGEIPKGNGAAVGCHGVHFDWPTHLSIPPVKDAGQVARLRLVVAFLDHCLASAARA